jgi:methionine synthase II (cobalamin-independent)
MKRILTTHVGSLPRPRDLLDQMKDKLAGLAPGGYDERVRRAVAERLARFAKLVGRDNVIAGADCGFSSQATYHTEVHPTVVWAKFAALRDGARLASKRLWS